MLVLKPSCELCEKPLSADSTEARICSYECTFCVDCVEQVLKDVCPNCGGNLVPRPIRPEIAWRDNTSLQHQPASTEVVKSKYTVAEVKHFTEKVLKHRGI